LRRINLKCRRIIRRKEKLKQTFLWILKYVQIAFYITAIVLSIITVTKFLSYKNLSIEFNKHYILCYRVEEDVPISEEIGGRTFLTKRDCYFDSITLNFSVMNNNPINNRFLNNIYLYISDNDEDFNKFLRGDEEVLNKLDSVAFGKSDDLLPPFIYQAQYTFDSFRWEYVQNHNPSEYSSFFEVLGVPSNDVKIFNVEFYPVDWYFSEKDKRKYRFKIDKAEGYKDYYILLFTEDIEGNRSFLNKEDYFKVRINKELLEYLRSGGNESIANIN